MACRKNENSISLPLTSSLNVYYSDTFNVKLATVLIDSLPTSTSSRLLAGHYKDAFIGGASAFSYLQFSLKNNSISFAYTNPVYDSISLLLKTTYSYGDTLTPYTLSVNAVTGPIAFEQGSVVLYNNTSFPIDKDPLGSTTFTLPPIDDTVRVPLSKELGRNFFDLAVLQNEKISSTANFKGIFNGIALSANNPNNNVIYGFNVTPVIRIYYHDSLAPRTSTYYEFVHSNTDLHSNKIINDRKAIPGLSELNTIYQEVGAEKTGNTAVMLSGIDLMSKIEFPYIKYLRTISDNSIIINKAQLIITPKENSYSNQFPLPNELVLYQSDNTNKLNGNITSPLSGATQLVSPKLDPNNSNYKYTFDITNFVNLQLRSDKILSLLLGPYNQSTGSRAEKLILDQNNIKLIIYLTVM